MSYSAEISRSNPTCFLFLVDQSASMADEMATGKSKAQFVADVLNKTLADLVLKCSKSDGVRNYFEVGVIGYGHQTVGNALSGALAEKIIHPIAEIEQNPKHLENRKKRMDDGAGGIIEVDVKFPVWFEAKNDGGTPMHAALTMAAEELVNWCDAHPDSFPPTILHITDGESTDGNPEEIADHLKEIKTNDGNILIYNLHVSTLEGKAIRFPAAEDELSDRYSKMLFRMSSELPVHITHFAQDKGYSIMTESRGFMFNADAADIVDFFEIGTRAAQLR